MSREFRSEDEAKGYAAFGALGPEWPKMVWKEIETIEVGGVFEDDVMKSPDTSEELKQQINERHLAQRSFRGTKPDGTTLAITIGPFRNGFECWVIDEESGFCLRL